MVVNNIQESMITRLIALIILALTGSTAFSGTPWSETKARFAWGADMGASIDMTGDEMSSVDFSAAFGVSRGWIQFAGIGAQANFMVSNSCRSYPIFLNFRTNFRNTPSLVFWDMKGGISLNYLEHNVQDTGLYLSTGIGIRLAYSSKFSSHIIAGYSFRQRRHVDNLADNDIHNDLHCVYVKLGVAF